MKFRTHSGSIYELDRKARTWTRLVKGEGSDFLRTESGELAWWPTVEVGAPVFMVGPALEPFVDADFGRMVITTPVEEILDA